MRHKSESLAEMLRVSFEDHHLSRGEKQALGAVLAERAPKAEALQELGRRAFALVRQEMDEGRARAALGWLEEVLELIDAEARRQRGDDAEVYFSPGLGCVSRVVSLFDDARESVDACVFTITDNRISRAMERAHGRGIRIRVLSDDEKASDPGSDIDRLRRAGIKVLLDRSPAHMHHKFAIFDGRVLVNGSYNWTRSASENNQENLVVTGDPRLVEAFMGEFNRLWREFA